MVVDVDGDDGDDDDLVAASSSSGFPDAVESDSILPSNAVVFSATPTAN